MTPTPTPTAADPTSEAAIFARVVGRSLPDFTPETARTLLTLGFGEDDHARIEALTDKGQAGALSAGERVELANYVKVGNLLALLWSKARMVLNA